MAQGARVEDALKRAGRGDAARRPDDRSTAPRGSFEGTAARSSSPAARRADAASAAGTAATPSQPGQPQQATWSSSTALDGVGPRTPAQKIIDFQPPTAASALSTRLDQIPGIGEEEARTP